MFPKYYGRYNSMLDSYSKESDRGAGVLAAGLIDSALKEALLLVLRDDKRIQSMLFDPNGPLGTFSAKIAMAFAVGLITENNFDDLTLVRRIRNSFAHADHEVSFSTEEIANRCRELSVVKDLKRAPFGFAEQRTARDDYVFAVAVVLMNMDHALKRIGRIAERDILPPESISEPDE